METGVSASSVATKMMASFGSAGIPSPAAYYAVAGGFCAFFAAPRRARRVQLRKTNELIAEATIKPQTSPKTGETWIDGATASPANAAGAASTTYRNADIVKPGRPEPIPSKTGRDRKNGAATIAPMGMIRSAGTR
jgi:hypothetical protein